jgi:hypothetical protein
MKNATKVWMVKLKLTTVNERKQFETKHSKLLKY